MDLNTYQQEALRTAIYPLERALDYTVLGLCSEVGEYTDTPSKSELGDTWWYWAAVLDALGTKPSELRRRAAVHYERTAIVWVTGKIAGATKKAIRDDEGRVTVERKAQLLELLASLRDTLVAESAYRQWNVEGVLVTNLNKLADRKERGVLGGSGDSR